MLKGHLSAEFQTGSLRESHRKCFGENGKVPEREHRNSFGKTEKLFRVEPLSQKGFSEHLVILEGARIVLVTSGIFPEKRIKYFFRKYFGAAENVPELPEMLRLLFADENH